MTCDLGLSLPEPVFHDLDAEVAGEVDPHLGASLLEDRGGAERRGFRPRVPRHVDEFLELDPDFVESNLSDQGLTAEIIQRRQREILMMVYVAVSPIEAQLLVACGVPDPERLGRADDDVYAVGGDTLGEVLHFDGTDWNKVNEDGMGRGLSGVFTAPDHPMIAVGPEAYVLEIQSDGSQVEPVLPQLSPSPALHGVWGDGTGTAYAVGGDIYCYPGPMNGVIYRRN